MYVGGSQALLILNLNTRWGEWLAAFTERFPLEKKKKKPLPIEYGTGWACDPVWTLVKLEKVFATLEHQTALPPWTNPWPTQFTD